MGWYKQHFSHPHYNRIAKVAIKADYSDHLTNVNTVVEAENGLRISLLIVNRNDMSRIIEIEVSCSHFLHLEQ